MGLSTALIGFLPDVRAAWACSRPSCSCSLRLVQGLALGGEYGGAATYVAEHVPDERRGYYTSFIQTTATLGFFLSLGVIGSCRACVSARRPSRRLAGASRSSLSFVLLARLALHPAARCASRRSSRSSRREGRVSKNPLKESFANPTNLRYVLIALFGATAGQGVVWYTGQFYALTFLQKPLNLDWTPRLRARVRRARAGHAVLRLLRARSPTGSAASGSCSPAACSPR